ncbi:MAG: GNAT family N-acetyltransferase [Legionellaceae bacterium]|nr:GNAT family N-acetyltransferase [Legionellaceae bacterium]
MFFKQRIQYVILPRIVLIMSNIFMIFSDLVHCTTVKVSNNEAGCFLSIQTPRLYIRSIEESDIAFFQTLWANDTIMEKFAAGKPKLYSGTTEEQSKKLEEGASYDYALWRIKTSANSWLKRRKEHNIWHGLAIFDQANRPIGHIVLGGGELAYFFISAVWNQGFATEAAVALVCIALPHISINHPQIEIPPEIEATVRTDHFASQNVLKKVGLKINKSTEVNEKFGCERYIVKAPAMIFINQYKSYIEERQLIPGIRNMGIFSKNTGDREVKKNATHVNNDQSLQMNQVT